MKEFFTENLELILSIAGTALPFLAAAVTCFIKLLKSIKEGKVERTQRLWAEFAQTAVKCAEALKGKQSIGLAGTSKKEFAMSKVEAACIKNRVPFERDKISEIIENIIDLTKKVNARQKDEVFEATDTNLCEIQLADEAGQKTDENTLREKIILGGSRRNET